MRVVRMFNIMDAKHNCLILLVSTLVYSIHGKLTSVIQTNKGPVRGEILKTVLNFKVYAAFKGIPYAKPPTGELRFKPPVEKEAWTNVLDTITEGSICTQFNSTSSSVVGGEDCLYINVFTPHIEFNISISKPVMVWIYGGAFKTGNSNASYYGPDFLIEENVIFVSFNYRLGPLGFLNLNHENATGNMGLKDQNLALKWVQKNIANFGGNPKNITIFGQSAGSVSVDLQVLSDMSVGLFQQAISMSGSTLCLYWGFQSSVESVEQGFLLGSKLGTNTFNKDTLLKILYNASATEIITAANNIGLIPFRPTIENTDIARHEEKFLTECSIKKYIKGNYTKGPHIMGFTSEETISFVGSIDDLVTFANEALSSINSSSLVSDIHILSDIVSAITTGTSISTEEAIYKLIKDTTNLFFITGIDTKQQLLQRHNDNPIYNYRFSFNTNYSAHKAIGIELEGVGHGDELPYIMYMPQAKLPLYQFDIALTRERIVKLWSNFAKYGNPTPGNKNNENIDIIWTESGSAGIHLEIGKDLSIGPRPTDAAVKKMQLAGLGASPVFNQCSKNIMTDVIGSIVSIIGLIV